MSVILEVCVDSLDAAVNAMKGGADRIEICSSLEKGGLSPGMDLVMDIAAQRENLGLEEQVSLYAMVRTDDKGSFMYRDDEKECMVNEIHRYGSCGVLRGVVFGMLQEAGNLDVQIDMESTKALAFEAQRLGLEVTFHRAFDRVTDKYKALDFLANECSISRVLTSGNASVAVESVDLLCNLVRYCKENLAGRIKVMPGSGITLDNVVYIIKQTGATEIHGSFNGSYETILSVKNIMHHL